MKRTELLTKIVVVTLFVISIIFSLWFVGAFVNWILFLIEPEIGLLSFWEQMLLGICVEFIILLFFMARKEE